MPIVSGMAGQHCAEKRYKRHWYLHQSVIAGAMSRLMLNDIFCVGLGLVVVEHPPDAGLVPASWQFLATHLFFSLRRSARFALGPKS
jgi:hypothetical protein